MKRWSVRWCRVLAADGAARHFHRSSGFEAPVGRIRADRCARNRADIQKMAGEPFNPGSPKQLGDIMFGKMGSAGRREDEDRRLVHIRTNSR
jgi:hypothetical protein